MSNKKMVGFLGLFLAIILIPQVALAAWWNPMTWFHSWSWFSKKKNVAVQQENTGGLTLQQLKDMGAKPVETTPTSSEKTEGETLLQKAQRLGIKPEGTPKVTPTKVTESSEITASRNQIKSQYQKQIAEFEQARKVQEIIASGIKYKISDLKDKIAGGEGFKIGNPDSAWMVDYLAGIFNKQIAFANDYLKANKYTVEWMQTAQTEQEAFMAMLPNLKTKEQLDTQIKNIQFYKDNLTKAEENLSSWSESSSRLQSKVDGIIAGVASYNASSVSSLPTIAPSYPPTFVPSSTSPYKLKCLTTPSAVVGGIETNCY
jgi:hypothetical protein